MGLGMPDPDAMLPFIERDEALAYYLEFVDATPIERLTQALAELEAGAVECDLTESGGARAAELASAALKQGRPFSLVRLGDGEGNILGAFDPDFAKARHFSTRQILTMMFGTADFTLDEIQTMRSEMAAAALGADVLGVSDPVRVARLEALRRQPDDVQDVRGFLGSYESILQAATLLRGKSDRPPSIMTNHVHRYLLPYMSEVIAAAREITLIGPYDLRRAFAETFGRADLRVHLIPNQDSNNPGQGAKWYPDLHQTIRDELQIVPGGLFLVAAGLVGKGLCHRIKQGGGVAIDMGSAVDVWRGVPVRKYHDEDFIARHRLVG